MSQTQTTELGKVKARIKALTEKTVSNGCTEAEAMAAAEMVGRLLERYALTMEEVDVRDAACVQVSIPIGGQRRRPIDGCVTAIARFCDCKVWLAKEESGPSYIFFGFEADASLAAYLFSLIDHAIRNELAAFRAKTRLKGPDLRAASTSFQQGMTVRIAARLDEMLRARDASVIRQRATGSALMLVKQSVVDDAFAKTDIRLVTTAPRAKIPVNGAFRHGLEAGDRVNLNRPVTGRSRDLIG
jgi:hypothetical protein